MASPLFYQVYNLNQQITRYISPFKHQPIWWDSSKEIWRAEANTRHLRPYYILNLCMYCQCGIFLTLLGFTVYLFGSVHKIVVVFSALPYTLMIPCCGLFELILVLYRHELTAIAKWAFVKPQSNNSRSKKLVFSIVLEIKKIFSWNFESVEWIFLLETCIIVMASFVIGTFLPIIFEVFGYHPVCILMSFLKTPDFITWSVKVVRGIMNVATTQTVLCSARTFMVLGLGLGQSAVTLPKQLFAMNFSCRQIRLYSETRVALIMTHELAKIATGGILGIGFICLLVTTTISVQGGQYLPFNLYISFPAMSVIIVYGLLAMFYICSNIDVVTQRVLERNRLQLCKVGNVKLARRILKSLRPFEIPLADIGIMDNDARSNYFNGVISEQFNMLIVTNDLFENLKNPFALLK